MDDTDNHIPPLRFRFLTPLYDAVLRYGYGEQAFRTILTKSADPKDDEHILDLGCGTGGQTLSLHQANPHTTMSAVDADTSALSIARRKLNEQGASKVTFHQGNAANLPYSDELFDKVVSALLFHHLSVDDKINSLRESFRVLKPGGTLHILDWGKQDWPWRRPAFALLQLLDGISNTGAHANGTFERLLRELPVAVEVARPVHDTISGAMWLFVCKKASQ